MNSEHDEIDLVEIFYLLKHKIVIILLVAIIFGIAGGFYSYQFNHAQYISTSKMYVMSKTEQALSYSDLAASTELTADYAELIKSRTVLNQVITNLNLDMDYESLLGLVTINNPENTRILEIQVTYADAETSQKIANEIVTVAPKCIKDIMRTDEPSIVEKASSNAQIIGPGHKKHALIGALAGAFLVCAIIIIRFLLNDTVKTADDVERYLELDTLGIIPDDKHLPKKNKKKVVSKNKSINEIVGKEVA